MMTYQHTTLRGSGASLSAEVKFFKDKFGLTYQQRAVSHIPFCEAEPLNGQLVVCAFFHLICSLEIQARLDIASRSKDAD